MSSRKTAAPATACAAEPKPKPARHRDGAGGRGAARRPGDSLDLSSPWLGDALDTGIGAANPGLSNYRPSELALIVAATCAWRAMPGDQREPKNDCWPFGNWIDGLPASKGRQFRHIWMYLMFPDECEPISSETHNRRIIRCYKDTPGVAEEFQAIDDPADSDRVRGDKILLAIRRTLEKNRGGPFSFYEPEYRTVWSPVVSQPGRPGNGDAGPALPPPLPNVVEPADPGDLFIEADEFAVLLEKLIVAKTADHLPLHRQEKIFERHGVDISRKTMCGWLAQCAALLQPLYGSMKEVLFQSKVIGTDDTSVKVLDVKLPFARTGALEVRCDSRRR